MTEEADASSGRTPPWPTTWFDPYNDLSINWDNGDGNIFDQCTFSLYAVCYLSYNSLLTCDQSTDCDLSVITTYLNN